MTVIEKAEARLQEEIRQNDLGADNGHLLAYWAAYLDGARAQKKEGGELSMSAFNYVERQGFVAGMDYAGMTAEEREALLKELRNLRVGPVASLAVEHDYAKPVKALRMCMERTCPFCDFFDGNGCKLGGYMKITLNAAAAIEALQAELDQWKAAVKGQEDGIKVLQAEVKRLQGKLCDWCAVCPKERRKPEDCELLGENPVMYGPSGAKMEVQE